MAVRGSLQTLKTAAGGGAPSDLHRGVLQASGGRADCSVHVRLSLVHLLLQVPRYGLHQATSSLKHLLWLPIVCERALQGWKKKSICQNCMVHIIPIHISRFRSRCKTLEVMWSEDRDGEESMRIIKSPSQGSRHCPQ